MSRTNLTRQQIEQAVELRAQGMLWPDIADKLGHHRKTVAGAVSRLMRGEFKDTKAGTVWTAEDKRRAVAMYHNGFRLSEIADDLGRTLHSVRHTLTSLDLAVIAQGDGDEAHINAVLAESRSGFANPIAVARADNENESAKRPPMVCNPNGGFLPLRAFA